MIKFIHTADIHFGVENYGRLDVKTGIHSRLLDFYKVLNFCVDTAIEHNVDFFLFAGDAYKTANPTPTHQKLFMQCMLKLHKANIPIVMVVGNHDNPLSFGKAHALDIFNQIPLDGFEIISKPRIVMLKTKSGLVQIVGIPWPTRNSITLNNEHINLNQNDITSYISKAVSKIIEELASQLDPNLPAVLTGHLTVSSGIFSGSEKQAVYGTDPIFLPSQLGIKPFDYVALGHLHRFQNLNPQNNPPIIYAGSLERIDFGERKEEKGFCLVKINNKQSTTYEFIKTPTRAFIQIDVYLNEIESQTEQILKKILDYNIANAIIKILYHIPNNLKDRVDLSAIQQACSKAWYIVGVFPIRAQALRQKRLSLKVDMDLKKLLESYFDNKLEYKRNKEKLVEKALILETELYDQENNKE
ncbi:metallophosphoesterase family protein [Candidatus Babela massiliensis]|uniref:Nuclease SbcCD subunit D n=1 Tax=Candidatus Babela massiliensis TaxID=673862 RepID=V6DH94_9BACT|nr:exonuclease SbcCD subunit D [Candidatus Babela massiliensis]CDK30967.1 DNA repair exonuclease SbcD [Candidatus Babela massiliensis]